MKISFIKKCAGIVLAGVLLLAGCSTVLENKESDAAEYGSLVVGADSRALDVSAIKSAVVTVTGNGIDSPISKTCSDITNGKGSVRIERIPVGRNRIVSVQARSADAKDIEGAVIRAVVNIDAGENTLPVISWETSRKGYVYNALLEGGVNISSLDAVQIGAIDNATPTCDATNINLPLFVSDFKKGYDCLQDREAYVLSTERTLKRLVVSKADDSTEAAPSFAATAYWSDGTEKDVTDSAQWTSSAPAVATVNKGAVALVSAGKAEISGTYTDGGVTKKGAVQTLTVSSTGGAIDKVYLVPTSDWTGASAWFAAYFFQQDEKETWVKMEKDGAAERFVCSKPTGSYGHVIFCRMNPAKTELAWTSKWNQTGDLSIPNDKDTFKVDSATQWDEPTASWMSELSGSYSGGALTATITAGEVTEPMEPEVTISPASGKVGTGGTITVTYKENNASVTAATVIFGGSASKTCSLTDFTNKTLSVRVADLGITEEGKTITVSASVTNSEGTARASCSLTTTSAPAVPDTFTWDNVNVYFVIQDRFYDGDSSNNNSYGRMSKDDLSKTIGTFHGGDIKGLTEKLDYLDKLGVNALWITAPYEQAHGWCGGGDNGDFAHYAYHGYYPLDYTMMDKNMGTVEEFRTFVTECHRRGIRVVMDVVMNHTGYLTLQDCQDYNLDILSGSFSGGKSTDMGFKIGSDGDTYHKHHDKIDYKGHNDSWAKWWGSSWVRAGVPGYTAGGSDDLTQNLNNLPDVKTENTTAQTAAPILQTKWGKETSGYDNWIIPAAKSLRSTSATNAPAVWIEKWLAAWVEEFGIDGFRCDTAKHVDKYRWGELKALCKTALANWRNSSRADEYAKDWDEEFWMTGESFGWTKGGDSSWFSNGFDSMIDFTVAGSSGMKTYSPSLPNWENRMGDSKALLYISSHDTGLGRASNQQELGTSFVLMPGLIQIYYGDETSRNFGETGSDENQGTRSDFNWDAATGATATHWGKVGTFRKYNPAVGAGTGSATKRSYSGPAGESKVAISISGTSVDVNGLFGDGTTVYNWYDGKSAQVSGGTVTFAGGTKTQPILVSDKNPADYGVTF